MRKLLLSTSIIAALTLSGCAFEFEREVMPGLPTEDANRVQPVFQYEAFESHNLDEASRKAVLAIKRQMPSLFRDHRSFIVGSPTERSNYQITRPIGRAIGASLTKAVGKTARAQHAHLGSNLLRPTAAGYTILTADAAKFAKGMNATVFITGTYTVSQGEINVALNVIRADDNQSLMQQNFTIPVDQKVESIIRLK